MSRTSFSGHGPTLIFWILESFWLAPVLDVMLTSTICYWRGHGTFMFLFLLIAVPFVSLFGLISVLILTSWLHDAGSADWQEYITIHDAQLAKDYAKIKIPIEVVVEAYLAEKLDFNVDLYEVFLRRNQLFRFCITWGIVKFYFGTFLGQNFNHSQSADHGEIAHVYNRGNDFYNWFLGETMIYTSGIYMDKNESLEDAQRRKMDRVCQQMQMKPDDEHLDIGCGWGTLVAHAAKNFGTNSAGVTLAKEQAAWGRETAKKYGVENKVNIHVCDYREIPNNKKYDSITCLEMAEHVGIKNFQTFLHQVKGMLKDDGLFYLQIAGLRRHWQFEDLIWGVFMGKYIFPAADASCPLGFVTSQLERAGFEVHRVENTGVHYSLTIKAWYDNWVKNKDAVIAKYGEWWFRLWMVFLAWSTIIAAQGSSTVFMVTCNINHKNDKESVLGEEVPLNRMDKWIGKNPIAIQQ